LEHEGHIKIKENIMPNEIHINYSSGSTIYAVIRNGSGGVWCPASQLFEDWGTDGHDAMDYSLPLNDKAGSIHVGDFNVDIPAGRYTIQAFLQAGANPADGDTLIGAREIIWQGSGELTVDKILANKAVQNKSTCSIDYYDDDGQTILMTITPSEDESSITRLPS
jgi:hypothetical protein